MNGEASAVTAVGRKGGSGGGGGGGKKVNGVASSSAAPPPKRALSPPAAATSTSEDPTASVGPKQEKAKGLCAKKPPLPASASKSYASPLLFSSSLSS